MITQADTRHKYVLDKAEIVAFLRDVYGVTSTQCTSIKAGIINTSLKIYSPRRTYLLRVYRQSRSRQQIERELAFNRAIAKEEVPTALAISGLNRKKIQVLRARNHQSYFVVLFPFLNGDHVTSRQHSLIPPIARIQATMHRTGLRAIRGHRLHSIENVMTWLNSEYVAAEKKLRRRNDLHRLLAQAYAEVKNDYRENRDVIESLPYALCHLDYDSDNILNDGTSVTGIIDFDDLAVAPPVLDLGFSLWWWVYHNPNRRRSVLDTYTVSYEKRRHLTNNEHVLLPFFIRLRNLILMCLLFVNIPKSVKVASLRQSLVLEQWLRNAQR